MVKTEFPVSLVNGFGRKKESRLLPANSLKRLWIAALALWGLWCPLASADLPAGGNGDDTYRFNEGIGGQRVLLLGEIPGGAQWSWTRPGDSQWDTILLGVRLRALAGDSEEPWLELSAGSRRIKQYVERGCNGLRWLNLTGLKGELAEGTKVDMVGHGVAVEVGEATLRVFANRLDLQGRILILATHPDDAEIAAFGLYAESNATIVTLTCGNAGDANYKDQFPDPAEQYQFKGFLRAVDSVTAPWQGGIPPERCFNLGYFDARLQDMYGRPSEVIPEMYGPNQDISVYRRANIGRMLGSGPRSNTWEHLVEDLVKIFKKLKPAVIVLPHPFLDNHLDHAYTAVAAVQALEKWKRPATFLLYTNHADENLYPYGPAGTSAPLPPWAGRELAVEGFYAHPLSPGLQRRKLFALETMHDLRLSPSEQAVCLTPGAQPDREDYPRIPAVDYFRRAPRPEELFFVLGREGLQKLVQTFLAEVQDDSPTETAQRP
jgi:LmbE family N-acetylglucosaminyl deacetylase